jgi:cGMP-dependent protein kinase 2
MLNGRANDVKRHKWFEGLDWEALEARKIEPPRRPKEDSAKRLRELNVRPPSCLEFQPQSQTQNGCNCLTVSKCTPGSESPKLTRMQENEKKQKRDPKETPEELQECDMVFADF